MRSLFLAFLLVLAAGARAESVHLADDHELGLGGAIGGLEGTLSGITPGVGRFDDDRVNQYALQLSLPVASTNLDFDLRHAESTTVARGAFSFDGLAFPNGANAQVTLNWIDVIWRLHFLEKRAMRLCFLAGGRVVEARVTASTTTQKVVYDETHVFPETGAVLEARLYPRARLYGLIKYFDLTSKKEGSHLLQIESGLSYVVPAPSDSYIGWRITGGFRYLNMQFTDRVGEGTQAQWDVATTGPFLEASRVF